MSQITPAQEWWSAAELAGAGLPDLPGTKRKVNEMAQREGWAVLPGKVRRRKGAGGGLEYHWSVLPMRARMRLSAAPTQALAARPDRGEAWARYEAAGDKARSEAQARLNAIAEVELLEGAGLARSVAVRDVARKLGRAEKSLWNWLAAVEGVALADRLAFLIDGRAVRTSAGRRVALDDKFCALVRSDWLRPSQPSLTSCYDRAARVWLAERRNSKVPPLHQVRRWMQANVSEPTAIWFRKGEQALRGLYPAQVRSKAYMAPLECVQGDYHKFDVFVRWPGIDKPVRPQLMVWSDVYSGKLLAWRLSDTANSHTVQLVTGDLIRTYGIPQSVLIDNGREFAAKAMTGGTPTRFRFKITDEDIPGLLPLLGVHVHWATPYSGQSKPIERAFRDLCDRVAKHPAFDGAYTGNKPDAKPEDYGTRAIPLDEFRAVLEEELAHHNARPGRRSEVAMGRSFNEVFNEGYARATIRRATDEQLRLWLLRAEGIRAKRGNGALRLYDTDYWSEWMYRIAGEKVVARFDADDLAAGLEVYDLSGRYLGHAACLEAAKFIDVDAARDHARKRGTWVKAQKAEAKAARELSAAEVAARVRAASGLAPDAPLPEAQVHQLVTPHKAAPKRRRVLSADEQAREVELAARVMRLEEHRARPADPADDDPEVRFDRARALERAVAEGETLTQAQAAWLADYQQSSEYRAGLRMARRFSAEE
ncbi:Mu DNA-binding domain-containing protein [Roseovarius azorensis]|uniref:Mu DNA-binding domain-containing protein n=1 Tax=Roseovarius azorensis TaxID=1287727 RepID=A0A1H7G8X1_9RHOB|nr:transposase domain-containing protein [Roseovarius azorensis]SEK33262.1 Mu DNA-binding domain-containing protein [Roseovarius azorensis]